MNQTPKDSKDSTSTTKAQEKKTKDTATSSVIIHSIIFFTHPVAPTPITQQQQPFP
jgi:hypothetical protein